MYLLCAMYNNGNAVRIYAFIQTTQTPHCWSNPALYSGFYSLLWLVFFVSSLNLLNLCVFVCDIWSSTLSTCLWCFCPFSYCLLHFTFYLFIIDFCFCKIKYPHIQVLEIIYDQTLESWSSWCLHNEQL